MADKWVDYFEAAYRKISIAEFHCEQLQIALTNTNPSDDDLPNISTQAFFEGTVVAVVSAIDQIAQATNSALNLKLTPDNLFEGVAHEIERLAPEFGNWCAQPIGRDLRRLRTRMVHYSYKKSLYGDPAWQVEVANERYTGSRELLAYAQTAVLYAQNLKPIVKKLQLSFTDNLRTRS